MKKEVGRHGYGLDVGLKCIFLQFLYDLSDRELEQELRFNIAYKLFCGFTAFEQTPDHSYFGRFRKNIGTNRMGKIFKSKTQLYVNFNCIIRVQIPLLEGIFCDSPTL